MLSTNYKLGYAKDGALIWLASLNRMYLGFVVFSIPFKMIAWTGVYSYSIHLRHCEFGANIMLWRVLP